MVKVVVAEVRNYLDAIPPHELGAPNMVRGLRKMINCIAHLEYVVAKLEERSFPAEAMDLTMLDRRIWQAWAVFVAGYKSLALK